MSTATSSLKKGFTAIDFVTLAVFGTLYRALWYVWHALGFLFPFNQVLSCFFFVMFCLASIVIVRKIGAATLFAIASQIINMFLQGEVLWVAFLMALGGLFADIYLYIRVKGGVKNIFDSTADLLIAGAIFAIWWSVINFYYIFPVLFATEFTPTIQLVATIVVAIGGFLGGWVGMVLGNRIKGLIN
jgi:hypothetical protein